MSVPPAPPALTTAADAGVVRLAERDPDLFSRLSPEARQLAHDRVVVRTLHAPVGSWEGYGNPEPGLIGLLVLEGLLSRKVEIEGRASMELAASGDLIKPWITQEGIMLPARVTIDVKQAALLGVLDRRFAQTVAQWPSVIELLMDRLVRRMRTMTTALTASHFPRVDDRIRLLLWGYAERWGRVTPDGILLPLNITHRDIGELVGARRPSVTTAIGQLRERGLLEQHPRGWLLQGGPPSATGEEAENGDEPGAGDGA